MLKDILTSLQVLSLPTRTNFRSVTKREVALFKGPNGWGEFSPFLEYAEEFRSGIKFKLEDVLTTNTPVTELENQYNTVFGSGIQIAKTL